MTSKKDGDSIVPFRSKKKPTEIEILGVKKFQIKSALDPYIGLPDDAIITTRKGDPPPVAFLLEITFDILIYKEGEDQAPMSSEFTIRKFAIAYAGRASKKGCPEISSSTIIGYLNIPYNVDLFKLFPAIQRHTSEQIEKSAELKMLFRKSSRT